MRKKSLIAPIVFLFLMNFVSAQFYGGFTDFLYNIDPNAMTLGVLFIVLFAVLFFSLSRIFKDKDGYPNKTIATVVALALSVLCVYWINRTGFDVTGLFYSIGISEEILYIVAPLIVLAGLIFLFFKFGKKRFGKILLVVGSLLLVLSFTDLIYEKGFLTIISIIMIVVGLFLIFRKKREREPWSFSGPRKEWVTKEKAQPVLEEELATIKQREIRFWYNKYLKARNSGNLKLLKKAAGNLEKLGYTQIKSQFILDYNTLREGLEQQPYKRGLMGKVKKTAIRSAWRARRGIRHVEQRRQDNKVQTRQDERMAQKRQKIIQHLQLLGGQKERELQKQEMRAADGIPGAKQKVRTLRAEIEKIARRMQRYSLS